MNRKLLFLCQAGSCKIIWQFEYQVSPQAWDGDGHATNAVMKYWNWSRISKYSFRLIFSSLHSTIYVSKYLMNYKILTSWYVHMYVFIRKANVLCKQTTSHLKAISIHSCLSTNLSSRAWKIIDQETSWKWSGKKQDWKDFQFTRLRNHSWKIV